MSLRIGSGIDVHPLIKGKPFVLAGVEIKSEFGIEGHSDGDVLTHSICDALLGALALGDLGNFFPSSNESLKNISSLILLEKVLLEVKKCNANILNLDATIILQTPHISPYIEKMRHRLKNTLSVDLDQISIKATTTDHLGFIGEGKGIASHCIVLIEITQ